MNQADAGIRQHIDLVLEAIAAQVADKNRDPFDINVMHRTACDLIAFYERYWGLSDLSGYSRIIAGCADLPESLACTALMLRYKRQFDAAVSVLDVACELAPTCLHYLTLKADILREKGAIDAARAVCEQVREIAPNLSELPLVLSQCDVGEQLGLFEEYYTLLQIAHRVRRPSVYLEIGVSSGKSLALAGAETVAIGIDPVTAVPGNQVFVSPENSPRLFKMTSDQFFETIDVRTVLGQPCFDMAFIDGLHLFEQVLRDLINLEKYADPDSIVFIHDCLPVNAFIAERVRQSVFWIGDVWKIIPCLKEMRPDLEIVTFPAQPSGLALIRNFDPTSTILERHFDSIVEHYRQACLPDHREGVFNLLNVQMTTDPVFFTRTIASRNNSMETDCCCPEAQRSMI